MSWVKLDDRALDDPRFLALPRTARLLHIEALSYTLSHDGSGFIPTAALPRLTDDEHPTASVAALADAGLWEVVAGGWRVVWLLDDQMSPDEIARRRAFNRERQERLRRHRSNDHSTCDPDRCGALRGNASSNASRNALQTIADRSDARDVTRYEHHPDPTRPERRGGGGGDAQARVERREPGEGVGVPEGRPREEARRARGAGVCEGRGRGTRGRGAGGPRG